MKKDKAPLTETPLNRMSPAFPTKQHLEDRNPLQGIPLVALNQNTLVALRLHLNAYISLACSLSIALKTGPEFGNVMGVGQAYLTNQRISLEGPEISYQRKGLPGRGPRISYQPKCAPGKGPRISNQPKDIPGEAQVYPARPEVIPGKGPRAKAGLARAGLARIGGGQGWPCQGWPCCKAGFAKVAWCLLSEAPWADQSAKRYLSKER